MTHTQMLKTLPDVIAVAVAGFVLAALLTLGIAPWRTTVLGSPDGVDNIADVLHPDIHQKVGQGPGANANANPNGANDNGGQIHGIANAQGGNGGVANLADVHGGIAEVNQNVD